MNTPCCNQCRQEFKSGLVHCLGITTCPCHSLPKTGEKESIDRKMNDILENQKYQNNQPIFTPQLEKKCTCDSPSAECKLHDECKDGCCPTPPPQSSEECIYNGSGLETICKRYHNKKCPYITDDIFETVGSILQSREQQARDDERKKLKKMIEGMNSKVWIDDNIVRDGTPATNYRKALSDLLNKLQD